MCGCLYPEGPGFNPQLGSDFQSFFTLPRFFVLIFFHLNDSHAQTIGATAADICMAFLVLAVVCVTGLPVYICNEFSCLSRHYRCIASTTLGGLFWGAELLARQLPRLGSAGIFVWRCESQLKLVFSDLKVVGVECCTYLVHSSYGMGSMLRLNVCAINMYA